MGVKGEGKERGREEERKRGKEEGTIGGVVGGQTSKHILWNRERALILEFENLHLNSDCLLAFWTWMSSIIFGYK